MFYAHTKTVLFARLVLLQAAITAAVITLSQPVHAADELWTDPNGGSFSDSLNWTNFNVPNADDTATFDLNSEYDVTFTTSPQNEALTVSGGTVTFQSSGGVETYSINSATGGEDAIVDGNSVILNLGVVANPLNLTVGDDLIMRNDATLNIGFGSDVLASDVFVGEGSANGNGTINVDGSGSSFTVVSGSQNIGFNGHQGVISYTNSANGSFAGLVNLGSSGVSTSAGTINVESNANLSLNGLAIGNGNHASAVGQMTVTGTGSTVVQGGSSSLTVGRDGGGAMGTLDVTNGGMYTTSIGLMRVFDSGTVTVDAAIFQANGNLTVHRGTMTVSNSSTFSLASGAALLVEEGGTFATDATLDISNSTATVDTGATMRVNDIDVGSTPANLIWNDGTLHFLSNLEIVPGTVPDAEPLGNIVTVDSGKTLQVDGVLRVIGEPFFSQDARLTVQDTGTVTVGQRVEVLGGDGTFDAEIILEDSGSSLTTGDLFIAGFFASPNGEAVVTVRNGASLTVTDELKIWDTAPAEGTLNIESGSSVTVGRLNLDNDISGMNFSGGTLTVTNQIINIGAFPSAFVVPENASTLVLVLDGANQSFSPFNLHVGESSNAHLRVINDATLMNTLGKVGINNGSNGTVVVDGANSTWTNTGNSTFGDAGNSDVTFQNGGSGSVSSVVLGKQASSMSDLTVDGANSEFTVNQTGLDALVVGESGDSTLKVQNGGVVTIHGFAAVAKENTSVSSVLVENADSRLAVTGSLYVGQAGNSSLTIRGRGRVEAASTSIASGAGSITTALVEGAGTTWDNTSAVIVGSGGTGTVTVQSDADVESTGILIANGLSTGVGTVVIDGAGTTWDASGSFTLIGEKGTGSLTVSGGAVLTTSFSSRIGPGHTAAPGASGIVTVDGAGSAWELGNASLQVGGKGPGELNISSGGEVGLFSTLTIGLEGRVNLGGGGSVLEAGKFNLVGGLFDWQSSPSHVRLTNLLDSEFVIGPGGHYLAPLSVASGGRQLTVSKTIIQAGGELTARDGGLDTNQVVNHGKFTLSNDLTIGDDFLELTAYSGSGELDVNGRTFTIESFSFSTLGAVTELGGGTIVAANGITLGPGSAIRDRGTIQGKVAAAVGSLLRANLGNLTLGDASSPDGFFSDGEVNTLGRMITLLDANEAVLGSLTVLGVDDQAEGTLVADNGVLIEFGKNMVGWGELTTPNDSTKPVINNGHITGFSPSFPITLPGFVKGVGTCDNCNITGTDSPGLSTAAVNRGSVSYNGTLIMEIGGTTPGSDHDQLNHVLGAGMADLGGTLDLVTINGYTDPAVRGTVDEVVLITAVSVSNTFNTATYDAVQMDADFVSGPSFRNHVGGGLFRNIDYTATEVSLRNLFALPGDADGDIDIDITDFNILASNFDDTGANSATNDWTTGDFDADGDVDITDFNFLAGNFAPTGYATSGSAVPEPASVVLALLAALLVAGVARPPVVETHITQ